MSEVKKQVTYELFSLSAMKDYKKLIGEMLDAIPMLVELLCDGTPRGKRDPVSALFNLSINHSNAATVVEVGSVPLLVNLLTEEDREWPGLADDALAVLVILLGSARVRPQLARRRRFPFWLAFSSASPKVWINWLVCRSNTGFFSSNSRKKRVISCIGDGSFQVKMEEEVVEAIETTLRPKKYCVFIEVIVHKDDTSKELLGLGSKITAANSRPLRTPNPQYGGLEKTNNWKKFLQVISGMSMFPSRLVGLYVLITLYI